MTDISTAGLSGFVPERFRLAHGAGRPLRSSQAGTALFCDIVGFSGLSERLLASHGRHAGAERLHSILDEQLGGVIRVGARHGGTVIAHAGDALTLWFGAEDHGGDQAAAEQAAACALDLAGPIPYGTTQLRLSLASGTLAQSVLGDPVHGRLEIAGGAVMIRLAELDRLPRSADLPVLVCEQTRAFLVNAGANLVDLPETGNAALSGIEAVPIAAPALPEVEAELALAWIPAPARAMLRRAASRGTLGETAEIRTLTAFFVHVADHGSGGDAMAVADRAVRETQRAVQSRGGTVLNVNADAKGVYVSCVFGAPVAHEDDNSRAFEAAADLLKPERGGQPDMRIGLARGATLVGVVGDGRRRRYDAIGSTMNRAALMMTQTRPGCAVAAEELAALAPEHLSLAADIGAPALRSVPRQDTDAHPDGASAANLIERDIALGALCGVVAMNGELPRLAIVEAEPGHGKTALLARTRRRAEAEGRIWLSAGGQESERDNALAALRPLLLDLRARGPELGLDAARMRLLAWGCGASAETPEIEGLSGSERIALLAQAVSAALSRLAEDARVVVAFDDGHWIDSASMAVLARLLGQGTPIVLILALRPTQPATMEEMTLFGWPDAHRIALEPLSADGVLQLARASLGARTIGYDLERLFLEHSGGTPLYVDAISNALTASGSLRKTPDGHVVLADGAISTGRMDFVESIEAAILARFDALPDGAREVARAASVIGRTFAFEWLATALGNSPARDNLEEELATLRREGYLDEGPAGDGRDYAFRNPLVQEAIRGSVPAALRTRMSARLADWMGALGGRDAVHRRARHLLDAVRIEDASPARLEEAISALQQAAEQARLDSAHVEASGLLEEALALAGQLPPSDQRDKLTLSLQAALAFCLMTFRGYGDPGVRTAYAEALSLADQAEPSEELAYLVYGIFSFYASRGEYDEAMRLARRLTELARRFQDLRLHSIAHQARAIVAVLRGRPRTAEAQARRALEDTERLGTGRLFTQAGAGDFRTFTGAWHALALAVTEGPDAARPAFDRALDCSTEDAFPRGFVHCFCPLPVLAGDAEAALPYAEAIVADADARGFALFSVLGRIYAGWAAAAKDPYGPRVEAFLGGQLQIARAMALDSFTPWFLALAAEAHSLRGETNAARTCLDEADALIDRTGGRLFAPEVARIRGHVLRVTDPEAGQQHARHAVALARAGGCGFLAAKAIADADLLGKQARSVTRVTSA